jgi:hypothetical protein
MVLGELGRRLNNALSALNRAPVIDEKVGLTLPLPGSQVFNSACLGSRCHIEGNHCSVAGIGCQCQTGSSVATESQGQGQVIPGSQ